MPYQRIFARRTLLDGDRMIIGKIDPIASMPLWEAHDLSCKESRGQGRISEETFKKIRSFRKKMAEWDRDYGWVGSKDYQRSRPK